MGGRDRANVTMLVYGVLRDAMRLRRIAGDAAPVELLLVMHALLAGTLDLNALRALAGPMADAADAQLAAFDASALSDAEQHNVPAAIWRSEEHTSELQSLMRISYAVFCLKKKKNKTD